MNEKKRFSLLPVDTSDPNPLNWHVNDTEHLKTLSVEDLKRFGAAKLQAARDDKEKANKRIQQWTLFLEGL